MLIQSRMFDDTEEKILRVKHELNYHTLMAEKAQRELSRLQSVDSEDKREYDNKFSFLTPADSGD